VAVPIYEFYCADCHVVFNFLACPRCGRAKLDRKVSRFAISKGRSEPLAGDEPMPDLDESKLERAMAEMAREADSVNEDDPRQMARMMRKLYDAAGLPPNKGIEEAIRRMEAGEDPDKIEEEMGDLLDGEDPLLAEKPGALGERSGRLRRLSRKLRPPEVDDTLYEL
jgi:hypothetical protein